MKISKADYLLLVDDELKYDPDLNDDNSCNIYYKLSKKNISPHTLYVTLPYTLVVHHTDFKITHSPYMIKVDVNCEDGIIAVLWNQRPENVRELTPLATYEYSPQ